MDLLHRSRKCGGGLVNSNNDGILIDTTTSMNTNTTTLPMSIMLYAVDEYWLVNLNTNIWASNYRMNENCIYHLAASDDTKLRGYSRRYYYGAIMITTGLIYLNYMDEQKDYATFVIRHYDSDNKLQLYNQSINVPYYQRKFSQYALNSIYQPVKPSEYPECVYWSFVAFNFDTGLQAYGKPVWAKLLVLYTPTGYDYITN